MLTALVQGSLPIRKICPLRCLPNLQNLGLTKKDFSWLLLLALYHIRAVCLSWEFLLNCNNHSTLRNIQHHLNQYSDSGNSAAVLFLLSWDVNLSDQQRLLQQIFGDSRHTAQQTRTINHVSPFYTVNTTAKNCLLHTDFFCSHWTKQCWHKSAKVRDIWLECHCCGR